MPTYSIKAPDGRTYQIEGPAGATDEQVRAEVLRQFPNAGTAPKQRTRAADKPLRGRWDNVEPTELRRIYETARSSVVRKITDPDQRRRALARFDTDPRMKELRRAAGLSEVETRQRQVQDVARARVEQRRKKQEERGLPLPGFIRDFNEAMFAGTGEALFGLPEIAEAGVRQLFGMDGAGRDFSQSLENVRAEGEVSKARSDLGNVAGQIGGGAIGGTGVAGLAQAGASTLARSASPAVSRVGQALQRGERAMQLQRGQTGRNVLRLAAGGAAGGGAQAAGEGSDVLTGTAVGAAAGPALGGLMKAGQKVAGGVRQLTRPLSGNTDRALRELITEDIDAVLARQAQLSADTGQNVPLVAALNDQDFKAVVDRVVKRSPDVQEKVKGQSGKYLRGFMDRMLGHVNKAGRTGNATNTTIGDLAQLRKDTADDLMRPIENQRLDLTQIEFDDIEREVAREIGSRIRDLAPRIREALKDLAPDDLREMGLDPSDVAAARRLMTQWGLGNPVTASVRELDNLRRSLEAAAKSAQTSNPANSMAYRNAAKAVGDFVSNNVPQYRQMVDTYAAQSRMMEGFKTAAAGQRITDIEDNLLRDNLRTAEGRVGLKAGELFRQREAVTTRPTKAIATAREFAAEGGLTRPASMEPGAAQPGTVTENLGDAAAADLARASRAETQVLGRMLDTDRLNTLARNEDGPLSVLDLAYGAVLGGALPATKARFAINMIQHTIGTLPTPLSERAASRLADMLFSQDQAMTRQALDALRKIGLDEQAVARMMQSAMPRIAAVAGQIGASAGANQGVPDQTPRMMDTTQIQPEIEEEAPVEEDVMIEEGESPYDEDLQFILDTENPELLALAERVMGQESGGRQFDEQGNPLTSSAGAIGIMQVMPETAPEAAALAGLPWDEEAYYNDPTYNKLLGIAYLSAMLDRFDGDVELALAAYNAGPGAVEQYGGIPPFEETQNYVASILR